MPKITFKCDLCSYSSKSYFAGWRKHLIDDIHQTRTRVRSKSLKETEKKRCLVVFGIRGLDCKDVLNFFSERNVVTDFIFWKEYPEFCIVEFVSKRFCDLIIETTPSVLGNEVVFRMRDEISDIEWRAICPLSALKAEEESKNNTSTSGQDNNKNAADESDEDSDCVVIEKPPVKTEVVDVTDSDTSAGNKSPATHKTSVVNPSKTVSMDEKNNNHKKTIGNQNKGPQDVKPNVASMGLNRNSAVSTPVAVASATNHVNGNKPSTSSSASSLTVKREREKSTNNDEEDSDSSQDSSKKPRTNSWSSGQPKPSTSSQGQGILNPNQNSQLQSMKVMSNYTRPPPSGSENTDKSHNKNDSSNSSNNVRQPPQQNPANANNARAPKTRKTKSQVLSTHHKALIPTGRIYNEISRARDPSFINSFRSNLFTSWAFRIQQFNLLVWENVFGIELYMLPQDEEAEEAKDGFVQDGPSIRGILTSDEAIEQLAQLSSSRINAELVKSQKQGIVDRLKEGVRPKPLRAFNKVAQNLSKRSNARLTFKLQVFRQNRPSAQDNLATAKPTCMLTFSKIITSDTNQFKRVVLMYNELWEEYSFHRIQVELNRQH